MGCTSFVIGPINTIQYALTDCMDLVLIIP